MFTFFNATLRPSLKALKNPQAPSPSLGTLKQRRPQRPLGPFGAKDHKVFRFSFRCTPPRIFAFCLRLLSSALIHRIPPLCPTSTRPPFALLISFLNPITPPLFSLIAFHFFLPIHPLLPRSSALYSPLSPFNSPLISSLFPPLSPCWFHIVRPIIPPSSPSFPQRYIPLMSPPLFPS